MPIELSEQERLELVQVVKERRGELSEEIHHATVSTYQDKLKARKVLLEQILGKLDQEWPDV